MEELLKEIQKLSRDVQELKTKLSEYETSRHFDDWIPRKTLMEFLDYGDTQMATVFKNGELKVAQIGIRKFIYKPSFIKFLEKNVRQ